MVARRLRMFVCKVSYGDGNRSDSGRPFPSKRAGSALSAFDLPQWAADIHFADHLGFDQRELRKLVGQANHGAVTHDGGEEWAWFDRPTAPAPSNPTPARRFLH